MAGLNLRWRSGASAKAADSSPEARSGVSTVTLALWLAVAAITLFALAARIYNVNWDEHTHAHPDERHLTIVTLGLQFPDSIGEYFDTGEVDPQPVQPREHAVVRLRHLPGLPDQGCGGASRQEQLRRPRARRAGAHGAVQRGDGHIRLPGWPAAVRGHRGPARCRTARGGAAGDPTRPLLRRRYVSGVLHGCRLLLRRARHAGGQTQ